MSVAGQKRTPWKPPQWLLDAANKGSAVPVDETFLTKLQYMREHPDQVGKVAREDLIQSGEDPDAFAEIMAEARNRVLPIQLAPRPKEVQVAVAVAVEEMGGAVQSTKSTKAVSASEMTTTPSSAVSTSASPEPQGHLSTQRNGAAAQATAHSAPSSPRAQRRGVAKALTTRQAQVENRVDRRRKKETTRENARRGRTGRASGTASLMEIDDFQPMAESSAAGARREAMTAAAATTRTNLDPVPQPYPYPTRRTWPAWYTSISSSAQGMIQLDRRRPQELAAIDALKDCIRRCEQEQNEIKLNKEYNDLRHHVHKAEIKLDMDRFKVKKTRILTEAGLPRIFKEGTNFPRDLQADAWYLYERWMNEDFEQNILRGIVTVKGKDRNGDRLDRAYTTKHPRVPKFFGDEGVVLGQWWPSQLCTVRDGVHGAAQGGKVCLAPTNSSADSQAGIYGDKDKGAYSIVLSGGGYHDQDDGDTIEYSGTDGKDYQATDATLSMIKSAELGNHIRVIRSSQLLKSNRYRPSCGLRYDGLYQVKSYKELDNKKRTYRFHLVRIPGQEPIRFDGDAKRPTVFEEEAYDKCKGKI
ncbi:hypothetical protein ST47_g816 [Ascochyta rabiei]|uniref:YDG domain-containing protein n=1 Tax=Didymella rabiei TaxID=5454 RepID=A0A163LRZ4_DIDRA|nr:hypothetical protein ST47_g816 [Ascochyta rabiei]